MIINGKTYDRAALAALMDFAVLDPGTTAAELAASAETAIRYGFKGVHPNLIWVERTADLLDGTGIETGIVAAFPFGTLPTSEKVREVEAACRAMRGRPACVDFVTNVGALRGGDYETYKTDIAEVVKAGHAYGYVVKSIMESALLTDEELALGCRLAAEAGVDFVKTSSGRNGSPDVRHVAIMRQTVGEEIGVKFSGFGGFNAAPLAVMAIAAGATRLGTRRADKIIEEIDTFYADWVIGK
ncbi:MAG: deoxyribose-phosphate aldolase [Ruminococcaceae bacterium]|nr:deoxyribose-phosphate aldolase [Oscillospiraceae bacterium]